jgi:hypothetical protein
VLYRVSFLTSEKAVLLSVELSDLEREQLERAFAAATQAGSISEWTLEKKAPMSYPELRDFMDREGLFGAERGSGSDWPYDWAPPAG